ncbi:MAG: pantoate--beta-alanine ligase [Candidatus Poribacteria bacterium]|nr:pantoate--beta-alanine ligase [Candidatus Poribacteria bacterium]
MRRIQTAHEMRRWRSRQRGGAVGFVPTMGGLHEGHLSLTRACRAECARVVVSVYVNPTQFNSADDLCRYPRNLERDAAALEAEGVNILFAPSDKEMYPAGYSTYVEVEGQLTAGLCGASRPGHFRGVTTVVSKLFHLVCPDRAYFGQKDAQQLAVIRRMALDMNWSVQIVGIPTVRDSDGLALSSRNALLSKSERRQARELYAALDAARRSALEGERRAFVLQNGIAERINALENARLEYAELVDPDTFEPCASLKKRTLAAAAAYFGSVRLIDNVLIEIDGAAHGEHGGTS